MGDPFFTSLESFVQSSGRPLRLGIFYTGGTFGGVHDPKSRKIIPLRDPMSVEQLIFDSTNLRDFEKLGFLEAKLVYVEALDSSQMKQPQRDLITTAINPEYPWFDGAIVVHGTDTGANTATDLHFSFPYYNPLDLTNNRQSFNATKPIIVLSSQIPVAYSITSEERTQYKLSLASDGPMNLAIAVMGIAHQRIGEAGILTNNLNLIRGTTSHKGNEMDIPPYISDTAINPLATHTSAGLRYTSQGVLIPQKLQGTPFTLTQKSEYEQQVISINNPAHLALLYRISLGETNLPKILFYETTGQGHIHHDDVPILRKIEKQGVQVFRVPLPGGRIPSSGSAYDVPGSQFTALNMQANTALSKGISVLALSNYMGRKDPEFIADMMKKPWGAEFLPDR